ncbi:MAG: DUF2089 domain-containing protein [Anaerolineae bacterium]|nr:DUF2089 domain-containing protein [Anaerolineae bacterium]MDW8298705.1 DUF2089 domain-containing protein [Anaerolineae bacterium]
MHPAPTICPICGESLTITRLRCPHCETSIEGHFFGGRLGRLSAAQLEFVEVFLLCEGKIKAVEERLGISYPTVRARLREVIAAMGYEPAENDDSAPLSESERRRVLDDLAEGRISLEEALSALRGR